MDDLEVRPLLTDDSVEVITPLDGCHAFSRGSVTKQDMNARKSMPEMSWMLGRQTSVATSDATGGDAMTPLRSQSESGITRLLEQERRGARVQVGIDAAASSTGAAQGSAASAQPAGQPAQPTSAQQAAARRKS